MASTSEELSGQGQQLQMTMSFFTISESGRVRAVSFRKSPYRLPKRHWPSRSDSHQEPEGIDVDMGDASDKDFERF